MVLGLLATVFTSNDLSAAGRSGSHGSSGGRSSGFNSRSGSVSGQRNSFNRGFRRGSAFNGWGWGFGFLGLDSGYGYYPPPPIIVPGEPPAPFNPAPLPNLGLGPRDPILFNNGGGQIDLTVPNNSEVWINGELLKQVGRKRQFITAPIAPNSVENYTVRIKWMENGSERSSTQNVQVRAGSKANVMVLAAYKSED
jgi:uncharacterized protein (TIGR03000 family)